jgi:hypothetical protein
MPHAPAVEEKHPPILLLIFALFVPFSEFHFRPDRVSVKSVLVRINFWFVLMADRGGGWENPLPAVVVATMQAMN